MHAAGLDDDAEEEPSGTPTGSPPVDLPGVVGPDVDPDKERPVHRHENQTSADNAGTSADKTGTSADNAGTSADKTGMSADTSAGGHRLQGKADAHTNGHTTSPTDPPLEATDAGVDGSDGEGYQSWSFPPVQLPSAVMAEQQTGHPLQQRSHPLQQSSHPLQESSHPLQERGHSLQQRLPALASPFAPSPPTAEETDSPSLRRGSRRGIMGVLAGDAEGERSVRGSFLSLKRLTPSSPTQAQPSTSTAPSVGEVSASDVVAPSRRPQLWKSAMQKAQRQPVSLATKRLSHAMSNPMLAISALIGNSAGGGGAADYPTLETLSARPKWSSQEALKRGLFLPVLDRTQEQLASSPGGFREFGLAFFTDLFEQDPGLRGDIFLDEPLEVLVLKLQTSIADALRLLRLEKPSHLASQVQEVGLTMLEYTGHKELQLEPFRTVLVDSLRRVMVGRGLKWLKVQGKAWTWMVDVLGSLLLETMAVTGPRVRLVRQSWDTLCSVHLLASEDAEPHHKHHGGLRRSLQAHRGGGGGGGGHSPSSTRSRSMSMWLSNRKLQLPFGVTGRPSSEPATPAKSDAGDSDSDCPVSRQSSTNDSASAAEHRRAPLHRVKSPLKSKGSPANKLFASDEDPLLTSSKKRRSSGVTSIAQVTSIQHRMKAVTARLSSIVRSTNSDIDMKLWEHKATRFGTQEEGVSGRESRAVVGKAFLEVLALRDEALHSIIMANSREPNQMAGTLLETVVKCATRPQVLKHKLRVMALQYMQMGVTQQMMQPLTEALFLFLETSLGPLHWTAATEEAWEWIWTIVREAFCKHMKYSEKMIGQLEASWHTLQTHRLMEPLATRFYRNMLDDAGTKMQALFARPLHLQHAMLTASLELLVQSMQDPEAKRQQIESLAMKHVKHDLNREQIDIFGRHLIRALQEELGAQGPQHWSPDIAEAWENTFEYTASLFRQVISAGSTNLVSRALAASDAQKLRHALDQSPRAKRALAAMEIEAEDATISPLIWTIRDGKLHLTEVLLRDILAMRGDRQNYYCGRELLWQKHPGLVRLLVDKAPKLVCHLLDGHLWTSRFIEGGKRRVNFYIRELYGDPHNPEMASVHSSMLSIFVHRLPNTELHLFSHPVTIHLVHLKWRLFARKNFLMMQALNVANLAFATAYLQIGAESPALSLGLALAQVACAVVRLLLYVKPLLIQLRSTSISASVSLPRGLLLRFPGLFNDAFMILNIFSGVLCVTLFALTWVADPFGWKDVLGLTLEDPTGVLSGGEHQQLENWATVAAFTTGLLWVQVAELLKANTKLSALYYAMMAVMSDVLRFLMVLALWGIGFSFTLYWMVVAQHLHAGQTIDEAMEIILETGSGPQNLIYYFLMAFMGLAGLEHELMSNWFIKILFVACVLSSVVVLMNLLVSTMVSTYDLLQRSCDELAVKSMAGLVLRAEESLGMERRKALFDSLTLDKPLQFEQNDYGPAGGIQRIIHVDKLQHLAYKVLDNVERFSGSCDPKKPWMKEDLSSVPIMEDTHTQSNTHKLFEQQLLAMEGRITSKMLLELDTIKRALHIGTDEEEEDAEPHQQL